MRTCFRILVTMACVLPALASIQARAESDSGNASFFPWSGYWWPHKSGGLTEPLAKYDRLFTTRAADWERENHARPDVPDWFGHCHAWSAASVSEKEPLRSRAIRQVSLSVGDQKGLLTACHAMDVSNVYGDRFGDGQGSEDQADLKPDELWRLLQLYLKQRKLPLICDLEPGEEVWNYPVSAYRVDYSDSGDGWYQAKLQLKIVENNVQPDYVGHQDGLHEYAFRFRMSDGAITAGSGEWTGESVADHPDFAWYPYVAVAENPEVDFAKAGELMGRSVGGGSAPIDDRTNREPDPPTDNNPPSNPENETIPRPIGPGSTDSLLSVNEIISLVANKTSRFTIDGFTDMGDGGRYQAGQPVRVSMRSSEAGYLYVFDVGPQGELQLVFPHPGDSQQIEADRQYDIPVQDKPARLLAAGTGQHDLKFIVTASPLRLTGFLVSQTKASTVATPSVGQTVSSTIQQYVIGKPLELHLHPAAQQRVQQQLTSVFRKEVPAEQAVPNKAGHFAQDQCSYFVLPSSSRKQ